MIPILNELLSRIEDSEASSDMRDVATSEMALVLERSSRAISGDKRVFEQQDQFLGEHLGSILLSEDQIDMVLEKLMLLGLRCKNASGIIFAVGKSTRPKAINALEALIKRNELDDSSRYQMLVALDNFAFKRIKLHQNHTEEIVNWIRSLAVDANSREHALVTDILRWLSIQ